MTKSRSESSVSFYVLETTYYKSVGYYWQCVRDALFTIFFSGNGTFYHILQHVLRIVCIVIVYM